LVVALCLALSVCVAAGADVMVLISALTDPERARVAIKAVSIDVDIVGVAGMDLVRRLRDFKYRIQGEEIDT